MNVAKSDGDATGKPGAAEGAEPESAQGEVSVAEVGHENGSTPTHHGSSEDLPPHSQSDWMGALRRKLVSVPPKTWLALWIGLFFLFGTLVMLWAVWRWVPSQKFTYVTWAGPALAAVVGGLGLLLDNSGETKVSRWMFLASTGLLVATLVYLARELPDKPFGMAGILGTYMVGYLFASSVVVALASEGKRAWLFVLAYAAVFSVLATWAIDYYRSVPAVELHQQDDKSKKCYPAANDCTEEGNRVNP